MAVITQTLKVEIRPVASGTTEEDKGLTPGDGSFATNPSGPRSMIMPAVNAQVAGLQGYLILIKSGIDTTTVEAAITALAPS